MDPTAAGGSCRSSGSKSCEGAQMGTGWNALVLATILNICWFDCLLNLLFGSSSSSPPRVVVVVVVVPFLSTVS